MAQEDHNQQGCFIHLNIILYVIGALLFIWKVTQCFSLCIKHQRDNHYIIVYNCIKRVSSCLMLHLGLRCGSCNQSDYFRCRSQYDYIANIFSLSLETVAFTFISKLSLPATPSPPMLFIHGLHVEIRYILEC